ncbi:hypothetical protein FJO69_00380 [[Mycoplasma] falconis]|uniref:J domain-containing protein n=1 Tax=[Mycoplasma] falconis TaxID=92403 RepID=A0A501XCG2_9BACT|nr:DnaJ domain-containing protein [[Mycoplasma] falconis]TPE58053.1 hypothetical protein FJO69_00380 [[Mycoplasma] falconis]
MLTKKECLEILGVSETATKEQIKVVYRQLANIYHPDKFTEGSDENKMSKITEAYNCLMEEQFDTNDSSFKNSNPLKQEMDSFVWRADLPFFEWSKEEVIEYYKKLDFDADNLLEPEDLSEFLFKSPTQESAKDFNKILNNKMFINYHIFYNLPMNVNRKVILKLNEQNWKQAMNSNLPEWKKEKIRKICSNCHKWYSNEEWFNFALAFEFILYTPFQLNINFYSDILQVSKLASPKELFSRFDDICVNGASLYYSILTAETSPVYFSFDEIVDLVWISNIGADLVGDNRDSYLKYIENFENEFGYTHYKLIRRDQFMMSIIYPLALTGGNMPIIFLNKVS